MSIRSGYSIKTTGPYKGTITYSGCGGVITTNNATWSSDGWKKSDTRTFMLGNRKILITNLDNKIIQIQKVKFEYTTTETGIKLEIDTDYYNQVEFTNLADAKDYIMRLKKYYLKAKEFEKQLNILGDFE